MEETTGNLLLLGALENVLGKSYKASKTNRKFMCPFCHHYKPKLEIDIRTDSQGQNRWACWVCGTKGRTIRSLLKHLKIYGEEARQVLQYVQNGEDQEQTNSVKAVLRLPEEFQPIFEASLDSFEANRFKQYLYNRGLTDDDFIRYNIGYCTTGKYAGHIIIPSYGENNNLNYFVARDINPSSFRKYSNPDVSKDIIFCENLINWSQPIIICEGVFDAIAIRRNATCLLGQNISPALMKKLITSSCPDVYLCLDQDAQKRALKHCETLLNVGKRVFFVVPPKKDPSETGFELMTRTLQTAQELTFQDLVRLRLNLI